MLRYLTHKPHVVLVDEPPNALSKCKIQNLVSHCPDDMPKLMGALIFPKRSPLIEPISRVTEFVTVIRKVRSHRKAKQGAENPVAPPQGPRALDFRAISVLFASLFAVHFVAFAVFFVERFCHTLCGKQQIYTAERMAQAEIKNTQINNEIVDEQRAHATTENTSNES